MLSRKVCVLLGQVSGYGLRELLLSVFLLDCLHQQVHPLVPMRKDFQCRSYKHTVPIESPFFKMLNITAASPDIMSRLCDRVYIGPRYGCLH